MAMRETCILGTNVTREERDYVVHAAKLANISVQQYIKRAINAALERQGVDAVLLKLKEDPPKRRRLPAPPAGGE